MSVASLTIEDGAVQGSGSDAAGEWTISGTVDKEDHNEKGRVLVKFVKDYTKWQIYYRGRMNAPLTSIKGHYGFKTEDFEEEENQVFKLKQN